MADVTGANQYFAGRLNSSAWDSASQSDKEKAITTATRQLEAYRGRADSTQFSYAVFEQAIWLLTGDQRGDIQQAGVQSMSLGSMSESYDLQGRDPTVSPQAWVFLRGPKIKVGGLR